MKKNVTAISLLFIAVVLLSYGPESQAFGGLSMTRGIFGGPKVARSMFAARGPARAFGVYRTRMGAGSSGWRLQASRSKAVRAAWREEQKLVRSTGIGTRKWTTAERRELLLTGRVRGYEGHHINSVKSHPEWAGHPNNIRFMTGSAKRYPFLEKPGRHGLAHTHARARTGDLATHGPLLDRRALVDRYRAINAGQKVPRWVPIYPK